MAGGISENVIKNKSEILVVDDSITICTMAAKMLEDQYIVRTAHNGKDAWEIIKSNIALSMVFLDMSMPVMNGLQLLIKIRQSEDSRIARLPVVIVTGEMDTPEGKKSAFDSGATDFIGKPFNAIDLLSRARAHIGDSAKRKRRATDFLDNALDMLLTPTGFHSVGCQALEFAHEKKIGFTVIYMELVNYQQLKELVREKNAKQIIISLAMRIKGAIRDEDVATRIGENKFAVLLHIGEARAEESVARLSKYMNNLVFEFNKNKLSTHLVFGHVNADVNDREKTFAQLCSDADQVLHRNVKTYANTPVSYKKEVEITRSKNEQLDLLSSFKFVIDEQYELVPQSHVKRLVEIMSEYLEYQKNH